MSQEQPDRLDRIEARIEENDRRYEERFDREMQLLADLRTRQEVQQREIQELKEASRIELQQIQAMRENLLIQSENVAQLTQTVNGQLTPAIVRLADIVGTLAEEFRQHRSDGHGA